MPAGSQLSYARVVVLCPLPDKLTRVFMLFLHREFRELARPKFHKSKL